MDREGETGVEGEEMDWEEEGDVLVPSSCSTDHTEILR